MQEQVKYEDVLVKVEVRSPQKILTVSLNEEFQNKVVIGLESWERGINKEIKVTFEDETFTWITCPLESFIYRTYQTIAVDGPAEKK